MRRCQIEIAMRRCQIKIVRVNAPSSVWGGNFSFAINYFLFDRKLIVAVCWVFVLMGHQAGADSSDFTSFVTGPSPVFYVRVLLIKKTTKRFQDFYKKCWPNFILFRGGKRFWAWTQPVLFLAKGLKIVNRSFLTILGLISWLSLFKIKARAKLSFWLE